MMRNESLLNQDSGVALDDAIQRYKLYERKSCQTFSQKAMEEALSRYTIITKDKSEEKPAQAQPPPPPPPPAANDDTSTSSSINNLSTKPPIVTVKPPKKEAFVLDGSKKANSNTASSFENTGKEIFELEKLLKCLDDGYYLR